MNNSFISQLNTDNDFDLQDDNIEEDLDLIFIDIGDAEVVYLEDEDYAEAKEISDKFTDESQQWQTYLNILALRALETWLNEQINKIKLNREECPLFKPNPPNLFNTIGNFKVGDFKICLIVIKSFSKEVSLPQTVINSPIFACHFYVAIEVLEDEEQALLRGIIRYDQLMNLREQGNLKLQGEFYRLPLACFDSKVDHLLAYLHHLNVSAIPLPESINIDDLVRSLGETLDKGLETLSQIQDNVSLELVKQKIATKIRTTVLKVINQEQLQEINRNFQLILSQKMEEYNLNLQCSQVELQRKQVEKQEHRLNKDLTLEEHRLNKDLTLELARFNRELEKWLHEKARELNLELARFNRELNLELVRLAEEMIKPQTTWQQWLEQTVAEGWATIENIKTLFVTPTPNLGFRNASSDDTNVDNSQTLSGLIQLLQTTSDKKVCLDTIGVIGEIGIGNPEAIEALINILHTTNDDDIRWEAASSLEKIDPNNPESAITRATTKNLITQLGNNYPVNLIIKLFPQSDGRMGIITQVTSVDQGNLLPNVKLAILTQSGKLVREIISRENDQGNGIDNSIKLCFGLPIGRNFQVGVSLDSYSIPPVSVSI